MGRQAVERLTRYIPNEITLPVRQWSMDEGIVLDDGILTGYLNSNTRIMNIRMNPGDFIRIEVYALDHSGFLNSENRTGALYMNSLTIVR
jgi:hypothetical protein